MSGNDNKGGNLIALVDMINSNIQNNVTQKLNIPDYSTNSKNNFEQETLDEEEESKQWLAFFLLFKKWISSKLIYEIKS